jgi:hypothetical protein
MDFKLSKSAIFILLGDRKVLIYETKTLRYVMTIEDVDSYIDKLTVAVTCNPLVIAHVSSSNKSIIKSYKFQYNNDYMLTKKCQFLILTTFADMQFLKLNEKVY